MDLRDITINKGDSRVVRDSKLEKTLQVLIELTKDPDKEDKIKNELAHSIIKNYYIVASYNVELNKKLSRLINENNRLRELVKAQDETISSIGKLGIDIAEECNVRINETLKRDLQVKRDIELEDTLEYDKKFGSLWDTISDKMLVDIGINKEDTFDVEDIKVSLVGTSERTEEVVELLDMLNTIDNKLNSLLSSPDIEQAKRLRTQRELVKSKDIQPPALVYDTEEIIRLYKEGVKPPTISKQVGCTIGNVYYHLKKEGLK